METSKNYTLVISQAWHLERLRNGAKIPDNDFTPLEPQRLTLNEAAEIRGCHALEAYVCTLVRTNEDFLALQIYDLLGLHTRSVTTGKS
ncbi:hypothetical protein E2C01_003581 [Portunus trituberculatus]|uniref:Uncharacterized protein n=1 Tax=Portunus trituberculatus TaxID=210409 RepID=A0A5B7CMT2_PORTR|nr:hypothetical protein [Portunus trituberculatus]